LTFHVQISLEICSVAFASQSLGPIVRAIDPWPPRRRNELLNGRRRACLAKVASLVCVRKGDGIFHEGDFADAIYSVKSGVVTTYVPSANGGRHIVSFLYPGDILGLSEAGRYTNSAKATTGVVAYRFPLAALRGLLSEDADLDSCFIIKLCDELRQAQRHALILAEGRAVSKLAMFLGLQQSLQATRGGTDSEICLPMDRTAIADFVGLSLPAVSRGFAVLTARHIISFPDRRRVKIVDRTGFELLTRVDDRNNHRPAD
jgi:CRP/FNR family transcriptional regulator